MFKILRLATALAAVCLGAATPAAALEPGRLAGFTDLFTPRPRSPDYELHMASYRGEKLNTQLKIRRHGDWVRVERNDTEGQRIQRIHTPTGVIVERTDSPATGVGSMSIRAPERTPSPGFDYASRKTGKRWKAAGQRCDIWEVYRAVDQGYTTVTRLGCVTRDGIEVARWSNGRTGGLLGDRMTGYYLRRGKMDEADIRPPTPALDLSAWLIAKPAAATGGDDYEVVLKSERGPDTVTLRRQGGSTFTETVNADGSRDMFSDRDDGVTVSARVGATGAPESYTARRGPPPKTSPDVRLPLPALTVLGQSCEWFDAMPDLAGEGRYECRTPDAVVLAIRKSGLVDETLTATTVSRRPLAAADLLPPAWLLDLNRWGVTD
ncbi:MAG: hypothetical protein V4466_01465 [Pseudomonadota bacterium]